MSKKNGIKASFSDFALKDYEYEILTPDGETLIVEMRDVTAEELLDATRDMKAPDVPYKEPPQFATDTEGNPVRLTDPESPAYIKAVMLFRQHQLARQIVTVWKADIPGETIQEKADAVLTMPSWAFSGLWKVCELVTATSEERIKRRPFRARRETETPDIGSAGVE